MPSVYENLKSIRTRVDEALERSPWGRRPVTILGASKDQSANLIRQAADFGVLDMGENYAQELLSKAPLCLDKGIRWHYIGRLQSNKIKHLLPYIASIHSVDSLELASRIGKFRDEKRDSIPILIQINLGAERQKAGLSPAVLNDLFAQFVQIEGVSVVGIMTIPPKTQNKERVRGYFKQMKELFDALKKSHPTPDLFQNLSMGMSEDFEIAVEEGATSIRIGTALFGARPSALP